MELGGATTESTQDPKLPSAHRLWQTMPLTDLPIRLASDKYVDEGIFRKIRAFNKTIYILIHELPRGKQLSVDGETIDRIVAELIRQGCSRHEMFVSAGTAYFGNRSIVIYPSETVCNDAGTDVTDEYGSGFLVCASRSENHTSSSGED